ncbi:MAG: ABC transporter permease [Chloroflexales bacterium]|nr:ABC transporter permease [Chloroflexales bacterium]
MALSLLMIALHTYMNIRWSNFVLSLGVGIVATLASFLAVNNLMLAQVFPWSLPFNGFNLYAAERAALGLPLAISCAGALAVTLFGMWGVSKRDVGLACGMKRRLALLSQFKTASFSASTLIKTKCAPTPADATLGGLNRSGFPLPQCLRHPAPARRYAGHTGDTARLHRIVVNMRYRGQGFRLTMLDLVSPCTRGYQNIWSTACLAAMLSWPSYVMRKALKH